MWRGDPPNETVLYTAPRVGRGDFTIAVLRRITNKEYYAVDTFGNDLSLEDWLAAREEKQTTKIITALASRKVRTYTEALEINPVLAFHHGKKIRRFIQIAENKAKREVRRIGFRPIPVEGESWTQTEQYIHPHKLLVK